VDPGWGWTDTLANQAPTSLLIYTGVLALGLALAPRRRKPSREAAGAEPRTRILVRAGARDLLVAADEIDWIEAADYCSVLHVGGRQHTIRQSLARLETTLDPRSFTRIHRSVIVNLSRVAALQRDALGGLSVVLADGRRLRVGRSRRAELFERLGRAR
jgi:two-component system LytT family response regulator